MMPTGSSFSVTTTEEMWFFAISSAARWTSASGPTVIGGERITLCTSRTIFSSRPACSPYCSHFRASEQVDDVLHPDDAFDAPMLVDDGDGTLPEGSHDLDRVFHRVVLGDGLRVRSHEV